VSATTQPGLDNGRVSEFWGEQFACNAVDASNWVNNQLISDHLNLMITAGGGVRWLQWMLRSYLHGVPTIGRSLSICCGDGAHEEQLYASGKVKFVHGFDISEGALGRAREKLLRAGAPPDSFLFEVRDANNLQIDGRFDLILSSGAIHHVTELEDLLDKVHDLLTPDGYFVVLEYVGPNRFQWTEGQCNIINGILSQLDPHYLKGGARTVLSAPPIPGLMAIDPSEAVRSEDIIPLVRERFHVEFETRCNGTLMHMLYPLLNGSLGNRGERDFDSIVRLVLYFEDVLIRSGVLPTDFAFLICRRKDHPSAGAVRWRPPAAPPEPVGYVDTCTPEELTGWAADLRRPSSTLFVDVRVDGQKVARVFCDHYRADVRAAGNGNGLCGYVYAFPPGKQPAPGSRVEVLVSGTDTLVGSAVVAAPGAAAA
jgi:SAM-dependent methyltransferase